MRLPKQNYNEYELHTFKFIKKQPLNNINQKLRLKEILSINRNLNHIFRNKNHSLWEHDPKLFENVNLYLNMSKSTPLNLINRQSLIHHHKINNSDDSLDSEKCLLVCKSIDNVYNKYTLKSLRKLPMYKYNVLYKKLHKLKFKNIYTKRGLNINGCNYSLVDKSKNTINYDKYLILNNINKVNESDDINTCEKQNTVGNLSSKIEMNIKTNKKSSITVNIINIKSITVNMDYLKNYVRFFLYLKSKYNIKIVNDASLKSNINKCSNQVHLNNNLGNINNFVYILGIEYNCEITSNNKNNRNTNKENNYNYNDGIKMYSTTKNKVFGLKVFNRRNLSSIIKKIVKFFNYIDDN